MNELLPKINWIEFSTRYGTSYNLEKLGYSCKLRDKKEEISKINYHEWLTNRKKFNNKKDNKKVSRAYFKLEEIFKITGVKVTGNVLCLAEAPGGFAQYLLEKTESKLLLFSLLSQDPKVPTFSSIVKNNNRVSIISNRANLGDITIKENIQNFKNLSVSFVTADGGKPDEFYDLKEQSHIELIYCEALAACKALDKDGTLILKVFDTFTEKMHDILCILSFLFDVRIVKPPSSRMTNSEKYLVCTSFDKSRFLNIEGSMTKVLNGFKTFNKILYKPVSSCMTEKIKSVNKILMKNQMESISNCLDN